MAIFEELSSRLINHLDMFTHRWTNRAKFIIDGSNHLINQQSHINFAILKLGGKVLSNKKQILKDTRQNYT